MASKRKSLSRIIYDKADYTLDEKTFHDSLSPTAHHDIDWSPFKRLLMHDMMCNSDILETGYIGVVELSKVREALKYPRTYWKVILTASEELMRISPHYYRLNMYYANMAMFNWGVDLYDVSDNVNVSAMRKSYLGLINKLESMNLKHEFQKIMKVLPYQDIYCGLVFEDSNNYFIQQVNFRVCRLFEIEDGLYNFAIDLDAILPRDIICYPEYVQEAYLEWKNADDDVLVSRWYIPPSDKQICIKFNTQFNFPYPLLIGLIPDLLDLDLYKKLKLQSARTDNYKAILIKVPIDEDAIDKPLITPETLSLFAELNRESLSDDIALLHTLGSEGKAVSFKDSTNTRNNVSDGIDEIYNSSGVSQELFNGSSSGTAVTLSVENDSAFMYGVYRQMERWVNRLIKLGKYNKASYKFKYYLLDMTIFNKDKITSQYKDAITVGATVIDKYMASIGMSPALVLGSYHTHQDIFNYYDNFRPLATSYTISGDESSGGGGSVTTTTTTEDEGGRPTNEELGEELSEAGEQTKDSDANADR